MRLSQATGSSGTRILFVLLLIYLFAMTGAQAQSISEAEKQRASQHVVSNVPQDFKMVVDVLDGFGGRSESVNYRMRIGSGGQPSPSGRSQSTAFKISAGYVHAAFVSHGDVNGDGIINVGDIVYLVSYLYKQGPPPIPMEAGDVNCDGIINVGDIVYLVSYLYKGGPPPCNL